MMTMCDDSGRARKKASHKRGSPRDPRILFRYCEAEHLIVEGEVEFGDPHGVTRRTPNHWDAPDRAIWQRFRYIDSQAMR